MVLLYMSPMEKKVETATMTYRAALAEAMNNALESNPSAFIMGQGVDDHKGIFGSTLNLHKKFGAARAFDTPLAEEGVTGVAVGASLNGLYPILTHIRADFVLLAMNQLINLAAKYRYMFGGRFELPMLHRLVVGRSWGQGAQHSQSLQSLFAHCPGLTVIMPAHPQTILHSYDYAVNKYRNPVVSIEHRLMYDLEFGMDPYVIEDGGDTPFTSYLVRKGKDATIVATSIMVLEALRAAKHLSETAGIECSVVDLHCLTHANWKLVIEQVKKTGKLIVADTSWPAYGVCSEVSRQVLEHAHDALKAPVVSVGMASAPCPTAKTLEDWYYPNLQTLSDSVCRLVTGKEKHGISLPDERSMADVYKRFKGPF